MESPIRILKCLSSAAFACAIYASVAGAQAAPTSIRECTRDTGFTPTVPGDYALDVVRRLNIGAGVNTGPTTTVPIRVRAP